MPPLAILDGLEIKLRQLSAAQARQRADYERLVAENQQLKQALDRQTGIVHSLKDKLQRSQPAPVADGSASPAEDTAGLADEHRQTIEFCLREVDRCLDWLRQE